MESTVASLQERFSLNFFFIYFQAPAGVDSGCDVFLGWWLSRSFCSYQRLVLLLVTVTKRCVQFSSVVNAFNFNISMQEVIGSTPGVGGGEGRGDSPSCIAVCGSKGYQGTCMLFV